MKDALDEAIEDFERYTGLTAYAYRQKHSGSFLLGRINAARLDLQTYRFHTEGVITRLVKAIEEAEGK